MAVPIIIAAVSAAASIATSASGASKQAKERYMSEQLAFLNNDQQDRLARDLASAKSEEERIKIVSSAVSTVAEARLKGLTVVQLEKEKSKKTILIVAIAGAALVLVTVLLITRRN